MEDRLQEKIELNDDGQRLIRESFRQYNIIAVMWILISGVGISRQVSSVISWQQARGWTWDEQFVFRFYPFIYTVQAIIGIAELYFYFKAIKWQIRSLDHMDSRIFNESFAAYKKGNTLAIIFMSITLVCELAFMYYESRH